MIMFAAGDRTGTGYLALPDQEHGPGVLVLHAWWGLNPFFKELCDRLARAGFVAFAPDLYQGRTAATIDETEISFGSSRIADMQNDERIIFAIMQCCHPVRQTSQDYKIHLNC